MTSPKFPSPYDLPPPAGAEDWKSMYPCYLTFRDELRAEEEAKFWFCDSQHWPQPFKPFDALAVEWAVKGLGQYNTRHYMVPPANGVETRFHNGYCYLSPVAAPEADIPRRVGLFMERAGYDFGNWPRLIENWCAKVKDNIAAMEALRFEPRPTWCRSIG